MTQRRIGARYLFSLCTALGMMSGCAKTVYTGVEPTARTFHEDPAGARDYYLGMNLQFTVDQEAPHLPAAQRLDPDFR